VKIDLGGKTALVTGASRGIGRAIALGLARAGASVALAATNKELLEQVAAEAGGRARVMPTDVADGAALAAAVDRAAAELGSLDILVNNAGVTRDNLLLRMRDEEWARVLQVNLTAAFVAIKAAARHMLKRRWGRVVNVSSVSGLVGNAGQANYAAAKAGLIGLTKSAARELASRSITVNAVAPGYVSTDMTAALGPELLARATDEIPLGRFGTPDDIAAVVVFLASEQAAYVTGQTIVVDGGMTMA
jgi:3-oxoacyl-[acyl-carrier protein] reductase